MGWPYIEGMPVVAAKMVQQLECDVVTVILGDGRDVMMAVIIVDVKRHGRAV